MPDNEPGALDRRAILDSTPVLIWASDALGMRVFFNKSWLTFTGRAFEKEVGERWTEGIHPEDVKECLRAYHARVAAREAFELEYRLRRFDGQYRWLLDRATPRFDANGEFAGFTGSCVDIDEQKRSIDSARGTESRLARILDSAMDAIISIDEAHRITIFNRGAERIFGTAADEAIGRPIGDFLPENFRIQHDQHIRDFSASGVTERQMSPREVRGRRLDGEEFPAEARISQATAGGQKVFTVILRDISDRKRAEDALSFLAETTAVLSRSLDYSATLEGIARMSVRHFADWCAVHIMQPDGGIERALAVHNDPEKERFANQLQREGVDLGIVQRVIASGEPVLIREIGPQLLERLQLPEDRRQLLRDLGLYSAIMVPMAGRSGSIGTLSFVTAESKRRYDEADVDIAVEFGKRAGIAIENALLFQEAERERAQFMAIVASVDYAVCQLDALGRIVHVNPAAESILGRAADELQGANLHELVHRHVKDRLLCEPDTCPVLQLFRSGSSASADESFANAEGALVPVRVHCSPITVADMLIGAVVAFEDIAERLEAERRKDDFLAFASHELRNPLTPILGLSRWLQRLILADPARYEAGMAEAVETLVAESDRMANIVDVFLDLSRIESNRLVLENGPCDFRQVIQDEVDALLARYPNVRVDAQLPANECVVMSDEVRVRQVAANLLDNAAKYGGDPAQITVRLELDDGRVTVRVRDRGPGISEEDQPHIFERFHRGTGVSRKKGFGVGLFLTKEVVEQLGGSISFTTSAGEGTEFVVMLPGSSGQVPG